MQVPGLRLPLVGTAPLSWLLQHLYLMMTLSPEPEQRSQCPSRPCLQTHTATSTLGHHGSKLHSPRPSLLPLGFILLKGPLPYDNVACKASTPNQPHTLYPAPHIQVSCVLSRAADPGYTSLSPTSFENHSPPPGSLPGSTSFSSSLVWNGASMFNLSSSGTNLWINPCPHRWTHLDLGRKVLHPSCYL